MTISYSTLFSIVLFIVGHSDALFEGEDCVLRNGIKSIGKCISIHECAHARRLLKQRIYPQICGFNERSPLVCCPLPKSDKKCQEYHNIRNVRTTIAHGQKANPREFPHMVALGYSSDKLWLCGGSLISELYILTAAHCTKTLEYGDPQWVRLGDLDLNSTADDADPVDFQVSTVYVHPNYKPSSHYNDIALLKLRKSVRFNSFIKPACIQTNDNLPTNQTQVIGFGKTDFLGESSTHLLKASLNIIEYQKCAQTYSRSRKLARGIDEETQICAGDSSGKDTCPGDSGGPMHFLRRGNSDVLDHYVVVGITSFGRACGLENSSGVYTRVSSYRSWIEGIVWSVD